FTAPYGTTDKTTDANGVGTNAGGAEGATPGTGADIELIPAGEALTSRYARTYDALIAAAGFAHGHHGHGTTNGNGFAGTTTVAAGADPVGGADGAVDGDTDTGGNADGAGSGGSGPGGSADGPTTAAGGGCSQPPGTKAVINITVPLSALLGFGFAFKDQNETDAHDADGVAYPAAGAAGAATAGGANTTGATGNTGATTATGPEPGAEPGPDPGGGTGGGVTTTATATAGGANANTGPPSTTPDFPGHSGFPGVPVSSG
ncbi:HNH endonuclease, partial [Nocardiopsis sp. HNM0947]|nr:HNH endonuclease [Nocardiopsis coralli]